MTNAIGAGLKGRYRDQVLHVSVSCFPLQSRSPTLRCLILVEASRCALRHVRHPRPKVVAPVNETKVRALVSAALLYDH
jgi:hypothetical protein